MSISTLLLIRESSPVFISFYDDYEKDKDDTNILLEIKNVLPLNFNLLYKFINGNIMENKNEIIKIVKDFYYLDSAYLHDALIYMKINFCNLDVPYANLEDEYNNIHHIKKYTKMENYLANDCLKFFKYSNDVFLHDYLYICAKYNSINCFEKILNFYTDLNMRDNICRNLFSYGCFLGNLPIVKYIIEEKKIICDHECVKFKHIEDYLYNNKIYFRGAYVINKQKVSINRFKDLINNQININQEINLKKIKNIHCFENV